MISRATPLHSTSLPVFHSLLLLRRVPIRDATEIIESSSSVHSHRLLIINIRCCCGGGCCCCVSVKSGEWFNNNKKKKRRKMRKWKRKPTRIWPSTDVSTADGDGPFFFVGNVPQPTTMTTTATNSHRDDDAHCDLICKLFLSITNCVTQQSLSFLSVSLLLLNGQLINSLDCTALHCTALPRCSVLLCVFLYIRRFDWQRQSTGRIETHSLLRGGW